MQSENLWERFAKTGKIEDYMQFKNSLREAQAVVTDHDQGTDHQGGQSGGERPPHHNSHIG